MKKGGFLGKIKKTLFLEVFRKIKSSPSLFFYMLLFDAMFLLSIYSANKIVGVFSEGRIILPIYALAYMLLYFLIFAAIYSFFKFFILHFIKSMFGENTLDISKFGKFYLINAAAFLIFGIIFFILSAIIPMLIAENYQKLILRIALILFIFFAYSFLNLCHSYFAGGKKPVSAALNFTFKKIPSYIPVFLSSVLFLLAYFVIYAIIGIILKYTLFSKPVPMSYNTIYNAAFSIVTIVIFYLINAFNRVYFYIIVKSKSKGA